MRRRREMRVGGALCAVALMTLAVLGGERLRAEEALAGPAGTVEAFAGDADGLDLSGIAGSVSFRLPGGLGMQVDASVGELEDLDLRGVGAHLFWRRADRGLVGLRASHAELEDLDRTRIGLEAEWYLGRVTLAGEAGYQDSDLPRNDDAGFGGVSVRWYPVENVRLELGGVYEGIDVEDRVLVEVKPRIGRLDGLAFFAEAVDGFDFTTVGLRFYFGHRSLLRHHREGDPIVFRR